MKAYLYFSPDGQDQKLGTLRTFTIDPEKEREALGIPTGWGFTEVSDPDFLELLLNGGTAKLGLDGVESVDPREFSPEESAKLKKAKAIELAIRLDKLDTIIDLLKGDFDMSEEELERDELAQQLADLLDPATPHPEVARVKIALDK